MSRNPVYKLSAWLVCPDLLVAARLMSPPKSRFAREALLLVNWNSVRMLSIDGRTIRLVTEKDGSREFQFDNEKEARNAMDQWMLNAQGMIELGNPPS